MGLQGRGAYLFRIIGSRKKTAEGSRTVRGSVTGDEPTDGERGGGAPLVQDDFSRRGGGSLCVCERERVT